MSKNMSPDNKKRFIKFLWILFASSAASFIAMTTVQYFMGGIRDIDQVLLKSCLLGLSLAILVYVVPKRNNRYPWQ
jgi:hypothetical protein